MEHVGTDAVLQQKASEAFDLLSSHVSAAGTADGSLSTSADEEAA